MFALNFGLKKMRGYSNKMQSPEIRLIHGPDSFDPYILI